jgi:hypothetical protein
MTFYDPLPPPDIPMAEATFKKLCRLFSRTIVTSKATVSDMWAKQVWTYHFEDNAPVQTSSVDCGVFVCQYMRSLALGIPCTFSQAEMVNIRKQMAKLLYRMCPLQCPLIHGIN